MIEEAQRSALLALRQPGEPLLVLASEPGRYRAVLGEPGASVVQLGEHIELPPATGAMVVIEGLDDVEDPVALLRAVAASAPARVLALVANAAFLPSLDAFIAGAPLARRRALVEADLPGLFAAGNLVVTALEPIVGGTAGNAALPLEITVEHVRFHIDSAAALARVSVAGYRIAARPA